MRAPSAEDYDRMVSGTEMPDDPKPVSKTAMKARKRAIREGCLVAQPRDELAMEVAPVEETEAPVEETEAPAVSEEQRAAELEG